jgi:TatD DNase family protein
MNLAVELDRPVSIHCLKAWGLLLDLLSSHRLPPRGFLLHSYGGPKELIGPLADLGAYFGFPGYFLQIKKQRQREVFRSVPKDRLLVETDAPDQPLPDCWIEFPSWKPSISSQPLTGHSIDNSSIPSVETRDRSETENSPWNHPANLRAVYRGLAEWLGISTPVLAETVRDNFERLFIAGFLKNPNEVQGDVTR